MLINHRGSQGALSDVNPPATVTKVHGFGSTRSNCGQVRTVLANSRRNEHRSLVDAPRYSGRRRVDTACGHDPGDPAESHAYGPFCLSEQPWLL